MFTNSDDLRRSLREIDQLLYALRANGAVFGIDPDEIDMLEKSRRSIVSLLEARRRQNSGTIVSLRAWRSGDLSGLPLTAEQFASIGHISHPQPGKPRLCCVS